MGWARRFSGLVVAGLVVLAIGLLVAWALAATAGSAGPGPAMLVGQVLGAAVALMLHRVALSRTDRRGYLAAFGVVGTLFLLGTLFWWS
ncbi:MAG: hypothetical protein M3Z25_19135 [Actinomycetota bacterium]|nr:hypothetical protein [Actinomycetota bacterium]